MVTVSFSIMKCVRELQSRRARAVVGILRRAKTMAPRAAARALRRALPPDATIALNPVGGIPYYSTLRTLDMLGITDAHIARTTPPDLGKGQAGHEKGDGRYILDRRPDVILLGNVRVEESLPDPTGNWRWRVYHRSEEELVQQPEFLELYMRDALRSRSKSESE